MWKIQWFMLCLMMASGTIVAGFVWRDVRCEQQNRALLLAVTHNDTTAVASLLKQGTDANACERSLHPLSLRASWEGALKRLEGHITRYAPARSALLVAVEGAYYPAFPVSMAPQDPGIIAALLAAGADVNAKDEVGNTALWYAALNDDWPVVSLLLRYGADATSRQQNGGTLLMMVVGSGITDRQILSAICDRSDINTQDERGQTALMVAILGGNVAATRLLLAHHADVNLRSSRGETLLSLAYRAYAEDPAPDRRQILRLLTRRPLLQGPGQKVRLSVSKRRSIVPMNNVRIAA